MINAEYRRYIVFVSVMIGTLFFLSTACVAEQKKECDRKKRDPFVALVHSDGKIKSCRELFPPEKEYFLTMNISLTAIIWDEERPLAMINKKIYSRGDKITDGLIVEDISRNSILLNDNGSMVNVPLRKKPKE